MIYNIYAYSTIGVSITHEILQDLGYVVIKRGPLKLPRTDWHIGCFEVDISTKKVRWLILNTGGNNVLKEVINKELVTKRAFRASLFIQKYQKHD